MDSKNELQNLSLDDLRARWQKAWGKPPHGWMGRKMMVESIIYKQREQQAGGLSTEHQKRINELIRKYKRSGGQVSKAEHLKIGTQILRTWKGKKYSVIVMRNGFEYDGVTYASLSKIATVITGTKWNGLKFFGVK